MGGRTVCALAAAAEAAEAELLGSEAPPQPELNELFALHARLGATLARAAGRARARAARAALVLVELPAEALERVIGFVRAPCDLAALHATARAFEAPLERALCARTAGRGQLPPAAPPRGARTRLALLLARERVWRGARAHARVIAAGGVACAHGPCSFGAAVDAAGALHAWGHQWHSYLCGDGAPHAPPAVGGGAGVGDEARGEAAPVLAPRPVAALAGVRVRSVAAGRTHCHLLVATHAGAVYVLGANAHGELGLGHKCTVALPTRVTALRHEHAVCVAAGDAHSLVLTADGDVYAWGDGRDGRLGLGDTQPRNAPSRIEALRAARVRATAVAAGGAHSVLLSAGGGVYAFGDDGRAPPDDARAAAAALAPARVRGLGSAAAVHVSAGLRYTLVVDANGALYSFGRSEDAGAGRTCVLGHGDEPRERGAAPRRVAALAAVRVVRASAGWGASFALAEGGTAYCWGSGLGDSEAACGLLAIGDDAPRALPTRVRALERARVVDVCLGSAHALAIGADGRVLSWGSQLAALGHGARARRDASPLRAPRRLEGLALCGRAGDAARRDGRA